MALHALLVEDNQVIRDNLIPTLEALSQARIEGRQPAIGRARCFRRACVGGQAEALEEASPASAEALYRQILIEDQQHAHAYLNLGFMLCESGRFESAVALYDEGIGFCPDDPLMHFNRAVAHEGVGDTPKALESYEAALRLQPDLLDAHRNAALLYADLGDQQMAIRHFSAFKRLQST